MNKRIQQLINKCTYQVYDSNQTLYDKFDKEKFAQLIVLECAHICKNLQKYPSSEPRHCAQDIRTHFGVD